MKKRVVLSSYVLLISAVTIIILVWASLFFFFNSDADTLWTLSIPICLLLILLVSAMCYAPISVSASSDGVSVNRLLARKFIPYSEIRSVMLCQPTMGALRICGSGGFFGYWGWFKERNLGKYFAYYGKSSDCFLVTLKSGNKYMLGCTEPEEMVDFINKNLE